MPQGLDPPELEFYRIRPFYANGRLLAHVLDYAPSPQAVVASAGYGRQPLWYCGGNHPKGCCHGPHLFEELWVGPASGDPTEIQGWRRPYRETRFAPHDIWLMANPVAYRGDQIWVDNGKVWGVPASRLGGVYAPANGEFSTGVFGLPGRALGIDAESRWLGGNHVGVPEGADEGHQAYVMVELREAGSGKVLAPAEACIITNQDRRLGQPLTWGIQGGNKTSIEMGIKTGTLITARIFFRAATIHALGAP